MGKPIITDFKLTRLKKADSNYLAISGFTKDNDRKEFGKLIRDDSGDACIQIELDDAIFILSDYDLEQIQNTLGKMELGLYRSWEENDG